MLLCYQTSHFVKVFRYSNLYCTSDFLNAQKNVSASINFPNINKYKCNAILERIKI